MIEFIKELLTYIVIIFLLLILVLVLTFFGMKSYQYFAPKMENIRRNVFESTRSYNEGKIQDLAKYRNEYLLAKTVEDKNAIKSTINLMFANYNDSKMPMELNQFLKEMRGY